MYKVSYSHDDLIMVFKNKYNNNWREFIRQKEGKWLYRNDIKLFNSFKTKHRDDNFDFRESKFQKEFVKKLSSILNKNKLNYKIEQEVFIGKKNKFSNRVDIILHLFDYNLSFAIELKHDLSYWQKSLIKNQVRRYNACLKEKNIKTYVVSPKGRYGFSENEFYFIINHLIKNEEILLPNSKRFIKKVLTYSK